jgi:nucleoside-diphosphate-sugar epimerase
MNVAVLGGTGFIGSAVGQRLAARGAGVVAISRGRRVANPAPGVVHETADRQESAALTAIIARHLPSALIDIVPMTMAGTQPVFEAVAAAGVRYVMISSCDVYANYGGLLRRETPEPLDLLDEESPLRTRLYPFRDVPSADGAALADEYDKIPIERAARADARLRATILRLPMVYGPGDQQHRFGWIVRAIREGGPIEVDERYAAWKSTHGFIADVAEAIATAALDERAAGRIYNVGEPRARMMAAWVELVATAMGRDVEVAPVAPARKAAGFDMAQQADLQYALETSTRRIRDELGFAEIVRPEDAIRQTVEWEEASLD